MVVNKLDLLTGSYTTTSWRVLLKKMVKQNTHIIYQYDTPRIIKNHISKAPIPVILVEPTSCTAPSKAPQSPIPVFGPRMCSFEKARRATQRT